MTNINGRAIECWVLYENPRDFPGEWVVRRQWGCADGSVVAEPKIYARGRTREACTRALFDRNPRLELLPFFGRMPDDDPAIVGCWL